MLDLRQAAEAAELLVSRRERDGLAQFLVGDPGPFTHQSNLWASEKPEAWLFGANRSGKTEALMALVGNFLRFGTLDPRKPPATPFRPVKVWVISLKYDMGRNIVQPKLFNNGAGVASRHPFVPDSEIASWNVTNQTLRLKNGSICIFKSGDQGPLAFQGADIDLAAFDEVPDEDVYKETTIRVGGGRRLMIRGAATILPPLGEPGGISWMFSAKVRPWLEAGRRDRDLDIFTASIYDNPTILPEEIARLETIFPPGSPEYLIRMKGVLLPTIGGSLVYSNFHRPFHMDRALAPPGPDGVPRPQVSPFLPLCLAVDFNPTNGVWLVGQKVNRQFLVLDEIALERSDIATMTYEFRSRFPSHGAEVWIYGDATGRRRDGQTGEASFYLIQEYLQNYPSPLRFLIPEINPPQKDRVAAVNRALRPGDGTKLVGIAAHCERLAHDLEVTKWTVRGTIDKTNPKEQSNGADSLGYWISYDAPVPRYSAAGRSLTSIRSPKYTSGGQSGKVFPSGVATIPRGRGLVSIGRGR